MSDLEINNTDVKNYCLKFKIETVLNQAINEVLLSMPPDPFSGICSIIKTYSSNSFTVDFITLKNEFNTDFTKVPTLNITLSYKGNTRNILSFPIPFNEADKEKFDANPNEIVDIYSEHFLKPLENFAFENIEDFDSNLIEIFSKIPGEHKQLAQLIINSLSISMLISMCLMCDQTFPSFIREKWPEFLMKADTIPKLAFSIFKTGKTMNSKVKFERFMLIINNEKKMDEPTLIDLINKIYASLRKVLTAGKAGENGMRLNNEGSFFPPSDNLNDILKLLENVIAEVNVPDTITIGIDCNANNYYVESEKAYEMDGFKKNPDSKQLIEFYIKLLNDHPLIEYLEEPFYKDDDEGLYNFMAQIKPEKPKVRVVSKTTNPKIQSNESLTTEPLAKNRGDLVLESPKTEGEKQPVKTDQPKKVEEEEESTKSNYLSLRIGKINVYSDILKTISQLSSEETDDEPLDYGLSIWDCDVETKQSSIVKICLGMRVNYIFINGLTMREEKQCKIKEYIEGVQELY